VFCSLNYNQHILFIKRNYEILPTLSETITYINVALDGCAGSWSKVRLMRSRNQTITRLSITALLTNTAKPVPGWRSPAVSAGQSMPYSNMIDHIKKDNSGQRLGVITFRKVLGADCATGVVQHTVPRVRIGD
jgi:hypothetical protein